MLYNICIHYTLLLGIYWEPISVLVFKSPIKENDVSQLHLVPATETSFPSLHTVLMQTGDILNTVTRITHVERDTNHHVIELTVSCFIIQGHSLYLIDFCE